MRARFAFERIITAGALCLFLIATRALADSASDFANANREYAAGHYQTACEGYEALVLTGQWNAALFSISAMPGIGAAIWRERF